MAATAMSLRGIWPSAASRCASPRSANRQAKRPARPVRTGPAHALAGKMPGAIALAATAAARAAAGYVRVSTSRHIEGLPAAVVQVDDAPVNDERIGCLLVGPGLGDIPPLLTLALTSKAPKV